MIVRKEQGSYVEISSDGMQAFLFLEEKPEEEPYNAEELFALLRQNGVKAGIDESLVHEMVEEKRYLESVGVAFGVAPTEGVDGYFKFHFNTNVDRRPKLLSDGSVDYRNLHVIEQVVKDQVVITYVPAVQGTNGYNVKGNPLMAKRSRDKRHLRGSGFQRSEDDLTYTSLTDGKIEYKNEKLVISNIYEVNGDADLSVGNIDFPGDVVIHGSVCSGVTIKAAGNIIVDGVVEAAELYANKDIVLRSGMLGGNKAKVFAKGNICARFFEYTTVEAKGTIQAEVFMDSQVICGERIILTGKNGCIIGGKVTAIQGIIVNQIGNHKEVRTEIYVGTNSEILEELKVLAHKTEETKQVLEKIEIGIDLLARKTNKEGYKKTEIDGQRKIILLREKIRHTAIASEDEENTKRLKEMIERAAGARIRVHGTIYPGVQISIDQSKKILDTEEYKVEYFRAIDKLISVPIED